MSRQGIPQVTKVLLSLLVALSFLNTAAKYATYFYLVAVNDHVSPEDAQAILHPHDMRNPYLTFDPSLSILVQPWVLVTSSLIEENLVAFLITFASIFQMGRYLEVLWTSREYMTYIFLINIVATNFTTFLYYKIHYIYIPDLDNSVTGHIGSSAAIIMGLLVAIKQRIPNHYLLVLGGYVRIRVSIVPFLIFLYLCFMAIVVDESYSVCISLALVSFAFSWSYLRLVKENRNEMGNYLLPLSNNSADDFTLTISKLNSLNGDRTESFSLHTFFPYPLSLIVKAMTTTIFDQVLVRFGIMLIDDFKDGDTDSGYQHTHQEFKEFKGKFFQSSPLNGVAGEPQQND
ncbi:hypothetical protein BABINDRAFT_179851 [Babjeviella inositovora NRRL Y-12698]|uniref:Peptidase S54 rhomboid domain-containing protein n=1 Tax=Babjeviella inositovora NRRL Y-12698 TaxID=984486 RepID=A0A1E3QRZ5_9ASCO|nr:uncharacterized protein BABINDRAFT_179851 [Babjeviella inositovora NRRL Y-12698]ODQ80465.1 hypothetical protein BABINDRAFT_179851 [Babjeviella inositovora NRRL Y-12698]